MNKMLVVLMLAGMGGWLSRAEEASAQGRRGGERPAEVRQPPPVARTPSLSVRPGGSAGFVAPRLSVTRITPPVTIQQNIQLPRPAAPPVIPRTVVTLPKREVVVPKAPIVAEHRPGVVPGSIAVVPERKPARPDLGKVRDLPREQAITRTVRPSGPAVSSAEFNRKLNDAWAKRPREDNPGRDRVAKYHDRAVDIRDHLERNYRNDPWFSQNWWNTHRLERRPWWNYLNYWGDRPYSYWWRPATWGLATGWLAGNWGQPIYYDYGNNVVYRDNYVYVNDVPIAPADVYADQAISLANAPPPPEGTPVDWMPLGTFGLASTQDNTQPDVVLQLAISKEGLVSGTSYNTANQTENTVAGQVDPATQRLAIHFGDDTNIVLETGLYNLTQESTPVLIHFGTLTTQTWFLVRLP